MPSCETARTLGERARLHAAHGLFLALCMLSSACVLDAVNEELEGSAGTSTTADGPGGTGKADDGDELPAQDTTPGGTSAPDDSDSEGVGAQECRDIEAAALDILDISCNACHNADSNTSNFGYVTDLDALLSHEKIVPGDAAGSRIYQVIDANTMPPAGQPKRPTRADLALIELWIDACVGVE